MKNLKKREYLPLAALLFGIFGLGLRRTLYRVALDEKNLLPLGHPLEIALWLLVLAGAAVICLSVRKLDGPSDYTANFSASSIAALGHFLMGFCILMTVVLKEPSMAGTAGLLWKVTGFAAAPAFAWGGFSRLKGKQPFFLIHVAGCLFLLMHVLTHYQGWSANPQLQDYFFDLFAAVALLLFSYYTALFEAGAGKRRMQLATGLLSLMLCIISLSGTEFAGLHTCGAVWAAADLCRLNPPAMPESEADHASA